MSPKEIHEITAIILEYLEKKKLLDRGDVSVEMVNAFLDVLDEEEHPRDLFQAALSQLAFLK